MGTRRSAAARRAVLVVLWGLLALYVAGLVLHGPAFEPLVDGWLGSLTTVLPALVLLSVRPGTQGARAEVRLLGAGAAAWSVGGMIVVIASARGWTLPMPSGSDAAFLCFPPLAFASIGLGVRRTAGRLQGSVWLDSVLGGLGAATALAVLLGPVLAQASGRPLATAVVLAYPLSDLLLVAAVVAVAALHGLRPGAAWLWLMSGLLLFAAADVVYALRTATDSYALGTPLDGLWSLALTVLATGAVAAEPASPRPQHERPTRQDRRAALAVPALATTTGLVVLVTATRWNVPTAAVVLATATLLAAAGRTHLAFRQVLRLHELGEQARTDSLTGLGNRRALTEHLEPLLSCPDADDLAVLFLDLDRFKEINDALGHHVGDQLLRQVGPRLSAVLRPEDLLVRLGGDEFAVVLSSLPVGGADPVARRLLERLAEPFVLDGVPLRVGASLGVALCPQHTRDLTGLLQCADVAMYDAKRRGGGIAHYDAAQDQHSRQRLQTINELRTTLEDTSGAAQLVLHYQPQLDVRSGAVVGLEALVRWQHPTRGLLTPETFLPLVEQTGLMSRLTLVVLRQAVRQCQQWRLDGWDLTVSVNLSASSLLEHDLPEQVAWLLASGGLPTHALTLEITESTIMTDPQQAQLTLQRLRELGVGLSIDDYGTGYCSLSYLQNLPVNELKLDRAFLADLPHARNAAIVRSTIELAHALDLRLVAEGIEDADTLALLDSYGCDTAQGYYLGRPCDAAATTTWLRQRRAAHPHPAVCLPAWTELP